jgi:asparagine synthase (glutamine-hydrolysing)
LCGIAVAIDWDDAEASVRQLIRGVQHRGDISDPIVCPRMNSAFGTRRLRIVDADHARQPCLSFDGRLILSFNGEIYNFVELRAELETLGVRFRTQSDTEVLANALQVWGVRALERLNGMYAFVALDIPTGAFLAARDPFGVKPLYLIQSEIGYLFCSEIRPLLDTVSNGDVLLLPPGYVLSKKICAAYKSPVRGPFEGRNKNDAISLDGVLAEAVRLRLPNDLPFATQLSGGIDSTLVAHYAQRFCPKAPAYFLGNETAPDFPYVTAYAEKSGIDLRLVPFDPDSDATFGRIDDAVEMCETFEPTVIRGATCSYLLSLKMHEDGFRVALCGEGADELFAGYLPLAYAFREGNEIGRSVRDQMVEQMHNSCLQRIDRCSMRVQLELREPFLDPTVVQHCSNLDATAFASETDGIVRGKMPLRNLYDLYPDSLPKMIRDRPKVPFAEGSGLDMDTAQSSTMRRFEEAISDSEFEDGRREFEAFDLRTKEELYYMRKLSLVLDPFRVPHLRGRIRIDFPIPYHEKMGPVLLPLRDRN